MNPSAGDQPIHTSVEGRPIEVLSFGEGERTILLMAGVHGDEQNGVAMVARLIDQLRSLDPAASRERIVVMPLANPDGFTSGTRRNARGVDINRNFPTKDFVGTEDAPGGVEPASEPETRAILDVMERFEPSLIITLHEPLACVNYNGSLAAPIAERMSECCGLEAKGDIGYPCPGSMGTYYGWERELPVITLELPPEGDFEAIERAVLAELGIG
ncbi:MAG: DUF2817 domain-containing protein [Armatimonadetes bacterium]|nr:DUF2817 domain-containing protein [Armatimonadota bacterium]